MSEKSIDDRTPPTVVEFAAMVIAAIRGEFDDWEYNYTRGLEKAEAVVEELLEKYKRGDL